MLAVLPVRAADTSTILVFGDSIAAGYRMSKQEAFPARLQELLTGKEHDVHVINAGISGDTTAGGVRRLVKTLEKHEPDITIVELGGNDMLRGVAPEYTRANLEWMLTVLRDRNITTILAGMKAPMNYGPEYAANFNKIYPELAEQFEVTLYPFILGSIYGNPAFMMKDGIHPNVMGADRIARDLEPLVIESLEAISVATE